MLMIEKAVIVIPARMSSTRFPSKPLAMIRNMTMIERVWRIGKSANIADVVIATDDVKLKDFAENFGAKVLMTSSDCLTGTDRVAEASLQLKEYTIFFSLQGDAVLTPPWVVEEILQTMLKAPDIQMATPAVRLKDDALRDFVLSKKKGSSSGTTVCFDCQKNALYFSKSLIPYARNELDPERLVYRHIGLYAYRKETLQKLKQLPEGVFEKTEKLEQLRALENGIPIKVVPVDYKGRTHGSVDQPEDISLVESIIDREGELIEFSSICLKVGNR